MCKQWCLSKDEERINLFEGWRGGLSFGVSLCWVGYFVLCGVLSFVFSSAEMGLLILIL